MSYSATINFKTIKEGELYAFFKKIKDTCKEKFDDIVKKSFIYLPSVSSTKKRMLEGASDIAKEEIDRAWMRNSVFTYRFFYIPEHNLLGVFSISGIDEIFDLTCHFQNSCDQDYPFTDWNGIPIFEEIASKWKNATDIEVKEHYHNRWGGVWNEEENGSDLDYYRRSFAYEEIWEMCEKYLYHEEDVVYISMFGFYEIAEQISFVKKCKEAYEDWKKAFEAKYGKEQNNDGE